MKPRKGKQYLSETNIGQKTLDVNWPKMFTGRGGGSNIYAPSPIDINTFVSPNNMIITDKIPLLSFKENIKSLNEADI